MHYYNLYEGASTTPKRKISRAIERRGVNYVRDIVESCNCTFTEVDLGSDLGFDAYIEFISGEEATGCCIGVQIKSGKSYVSSDQRTYYLRGDKDHFGYWKSHVLPIAGIVFNPLERKAAWCDVTEYLESNSEVIEKGPYQIPISSNDEFGKNTFNDFIRHFLEYQIKYKEGDNFGRALQYFADVRDTQKCFEGMKALFFFHRNWKATWYYLISSFANIENKFLRTKLIICLGHIPGHPDILWFDSNIINEDTRKYALSLIKERFGRKETEFLLELVDELGFARATIGQWVHAIIDVIPNRNRILKSITFDEQIDEKVRCDSLMLLIYYVQISSPERCIQLIKAYLSRFPVSGYADTLLEMAKIIKEFGSVSFY